MISDLERFEIVQVMFPDELPDGDSDLGDEEDVIIEHFDMDPEDFDRLVGMLIYCAPVMAGGMTGKAYHVLGKVSVKDDQQSIIAAIKREPK